MTELVKWINETDEERWNRLEYINQRLRHYMLNKDKRVFIPLVRLRKNVMWNGYIFKGGLELEGVKPTSCVTAYSDDRDHSNIVFSFSNGDSDYMRPIGQARLTDIEYIEELP